ncbi:hypothetical protein BDV27DRAFT_138229 [Aspergillus caelatus]|uniref:Uncharacterized protein n=1 Tax=Aspergillus caelatus TaxID=61420 RepID=A0A5N6ZKD5_9EURO|nr:uncharacterized protein BDV27DRAFT_138229 [Aspergillus caelatus]KAE8358094.1 hypothetical protein BDV27DRAFT_138229 [Aspergillus caelatus]
MEQCGLLSKPEIPKVATTDSMQGKKGKVILYDCVVSNVDHLSDLGFSIEDHSWAVGSRVFFPIILQIQAPLPLPEPTSNRPPNVIVWLDISQLHSRGVLVSDST